MAERIGKKESVITWDDVDFDRGVIHTTKATVFVNNQPTIRNPKTKNSIRDIFERQTIECKYKQIERIY